MGKGTFLIAVKAGFTAILPMERAAEMYPEKVRKRFLSLTLNGDVDKLQMTKGKGEIDAVSGKVCRVYEKNTCPVAITRFGPLFLMKITYIT